jgi:hypothetical protein
MPEGRGSLLSDLCGILAGRFAIALAVHGRQGKEETR